MVMFTCSRSSNFINFSVTRIKSIFCFFNNKTLKRNSKEVCATYYNMKISLKEKIQDIEKICAINFFVNFFLKCSIEARIAILYLHHYQFRQCNKIILKDEISVFLKTPELSYNDACQFFFLWCQFFLLPLIFEVHILSQQ